MVGSVRLLGTVVALAALPLTAAAALFNMSLRPQEETHALTLSLEDLYPTVFLGPPGLTGTATVELDITTRQVTVTGNYLGMSSNVFASHLHGLAGMGDVAGVILPLTPTEGTAGTFSGSGTLSNAHLAGLLAGNTYLNLHTENNPDGEIRGQVIDRDVLVYNIGLDTAQQPHPLDLSGAAPTGSATVVIDTSSSQIQVLGRYTGMTTAVVEANIYLVRTHGNTLNPTFAGEVPEAIMDLTPTPSTRGRFSGTGTLSSAQIDGLLTGNTYLNIHTGRHPDGEIRGQIVDAGVVVVPKLSVTPRTIDGSNNNRDNSSWGQANTPEIRLTAVDYVDGISEVRTDIHGRPNARQISSRIFAQSNTEEFLDENKLNEMTWAWGQFVDHDINFTDDGAETHEITIPDDDAGFALDSDGMITFKRKSFTPGTGTSTENPRQFNNFITAWIDASLVYGSDPTRASALRDNGGTGAKLRTHEYGDPDTDRDNLLPTADDLISAGVPLPPSERVRFEAGDVRSNENTAILALHTLMLREHNRIVDAMSVADPGMTDEEKYQIAKKIVGAEMQAITYNDYLPALGVHVDTSGGYDPNVDPRISVEFSQGVFRMGHTSINEQAPRLNNDLTPHEAGPITLEQTFFNPTAIFETGPILRSAFLE